MARNEGKAKSARRALREINVSNNHNSNNGGGGGGGKFSKSVNITKKLISEKQIQNRQSVPMVQQETGDGGEEDYLDRLLLVQSDLSSLTRQIDELVAQAFKVKAPSKEGRREVESLSHVLLDMLSSLKPWVHRFQKALSSSSESENQLGQCFGDRIVPAVKEDENLEVGSPEQTTMNSLISPSPLVSWRANCNVERGKQLFLLTPLPMSKTLSSKHQEWSKSLFEIERIASNPAVELPSIFSVSGDLNDDLLEGIATKPTPVKANNSIVNEAKRNLDSECSSPPILSIKDHSVFVMTPCLKMSPPKSCVLLEPISESSPKRKPIVRQSTPFPIGCQSQISDSEGEGSEDLAIKFPELLGIQAAFISRMGKEELEASPVWSFSPPKTCALLEAAYKPRMGEKELGASPEWSFSPPKTCVLLEPPDEKSPDTVDASGKHLPISTPMLNQQTNLKLSTEDHNYQDGCHGIKKSCNQEGKNSSLALVESTPMWNEPESKIRGGKRAGENTLKKELWTKFEAASSYGFRLNVSAIQRTAQKGFLDMLDEVSLDDD